MAENVNMIVAGVPIELKQLLVAEAKHRGVSINDHAAGILSAKFGVERSPSGVPFRPDHGSTRMMFGVPAELRTKIRVKAATDGTTMKDVVLEALADHFGFSLAAAA